MLSRFKKTSTFFKILMNYDVSETEVRRLFRTFGIQKKHQLFEFCISKMDFTLDLSYCKAQPNKKFIFEGRGKHTIKPYRILGTNKEKYFEKIFYSDSPDARANIYFYHNHKKLLKNKNITIPACKDIIRGEKFTTFLYEFLDLKPLVPGTEYQNLKAVTISLCQRTERKTEADPMSYEKIIDGNTRIRKLNIFTAMQLKKMEKIIQLLPVSFQHLDLKEENVFQENVIVDWDNAGWHPMGMDFARLLLSYYIFHEDIFYDHYMEEILEYHSSLDEIIAIETFKVVVIYFFIVYYFGHFGEDDPTNKFKDFIEAFKFGLLDKLHD